MPFPLSTQVSLQKLITYGIVHFVYEQVILSTTSLVACMGGGEGGGHCSVISVTAFAKKKKKKKHEKKVEVGNDPEIDTCNTIIMSLRYI